MRGIQRLRGIDLLDPLRLQRELANAVADDLISRAEAGETQALQVYVEALKALALHRLSERLPEQLGKGLTTLRDLQKTVARLQ
jgi:hypothetical protein